MRDMMGLMKQAQAMQEKMAALQAELDHVTVEGLAGGGMVRTIMTAKGALKSIIIDESLLKPAEREMLEDLIVAAHEDARRKADEAMQAKMAEITAGLPLPPGMKLPF